MKAGSKIRLWVSAGVLVALVGLLNFGVSRDVPRELRSMGLQHTNPIKSSIGNNSFNGKSTTSYLLTAAQPDSFREAFRSSGSPWKVKENGSVLVADLIEEKRNRYIVIVRRRKLGGCTVEIISNSRTGDEFRRWFQETTGL